MTKKVGRPAEIRTVESLLSNTTLDPATGCRTWNGSRDRDGYGNTSLVGVLIKAHRLMFQISTGTVLPEGIKVIHRCHNPPCINPDHLISGTQLENIMTSNEDGRLGLKEADVREIRRRYKPQVCSYEKLAAEYGVSKGCIQSVISRRTWNHLPVEACELHRESPITVLTDQQIAEIKTKYIPYKYTIDRLASEYKVGKDRIREILANADLVQSVRRG